MANPMQPPKPPQDVNAMRQKFFSGQRDDIERQQNMAGQQASDAIQRRMASIGQAGSGAAMGLELKSQRDIAEQGNAQRNALGGQELQANIQSQEAQLGRDLQESQFGRNLEQQAGQFGKQMEASRGMFDVEQGNKLKQLDLAERQFGLDKDVTAFNQRMAEIEANRPTPGMFGNLGIPGLKGPGDVPATMIDPLNLRANIPGVKNVPGLGGGGGGK